MSREISRDLSVAAVVFLTLFGAPIAEGFHSGQIWNLRPPIEAGRNLPEVAVYVRETVDQFLEGKHPLVTVISSNLRSTSAVPQHPIASNAI